MSGAPAAPAAPAPPVRRLTVLHDPTCPLCRRLSGWLRDQRQLVPLAFVAAASAEARQRFPGVDHDATLGEVTVVADTGEVWTGPHAFVVCLWALADHRPLAHRLSTPAGLPLARAAAFAAGKYRAATRGGAVPGAEGAPGTAPGLPRGRDWPDWYRNAWDRSAWDRDTRDRNGRWRNGPPGPGCAGGMCSVPG
ncbi:DCC1-like thiol-disulfide oxidoreductase family protein [Streptomyces sp. NPDC092296]|uniref:DCC1-like thiol-disulfide oxidoreductase family protein n=1 Tax=Streptomyces sp. NPDC092296 TaxID=3366012 RepID=UPI0038149A7B